MTQVKSAQILSRELARYMGTDQRSLAARRVAFAAQMRAMALSELSEVSKRLKGLKRELEGKDGKKWPDYELAREMGIKPRTFQSWQNGEVENQDGKGYDKIARFYSKKLARKITRQWIVFGDPEIAGDPEIPSGTPEPTEVNHLSKILSAQGKALTKLSAELERERKAQREMLSRIEHLEHGQEEAG